MNGHFLKLHLNMFERSQGNIIIWIVIISINCNFYMLKAWHKSKIFLHVQSTQTLKMGSPCFFQTSFFPTKCSPFLLKIGKDFNIDDFKGKSTWLMKKNYIKNLNTFDFKCVFDLENYGFKKCGLNKRCSYLCDKGHECIIYLI